MRDSLKALVTDLDGVIRFFPSARDREIELAHNLPLGTLGKTAFEPTLLEQVITGKMSDEEWRSTIYLKIRSSFPTTDSETAVALWSEFIGNIDEDAIAFLESVLPGKLIALLTNATTRLEADLDKAGIAHRFKRIFNSSRLGMAKPSPDLFKHVATELGLLPREILFIDDSKKNVDAAKDLGFISFHYSDLPTLRRDLTDLFG